MNLLNRRNVKAILGLGLLFSCLPHLHGQNPAQRVVDLRPKTVATFNGMNVTEDELRAAAAADLDELKVRSQQFYATMARAERQVLETNLIRLLADKMFEAEAAKRGVTKEKLLESELAGKIKDPSADEIKAFYDANKQSYKQPLEKVSGDIRKFFVQERRDKAISEYADRLKAQYGVRVLLPPLRVNVKAEGSPSLGPKEAPVTMVVFSDFQSEFCSQLDKTLHEAVKKYGDKVRLVYRNFTVPSIHPLAGKAAEASLCAGDQNHFWEMHDLLFETQSQLKEADLKAKAAKLKLDTGAFNECLTSGKYAARVKQDQREGNVLGIAATPTLFINGRFLSGALPLTGISRVIDEEIRFTSLRAAAAAQEASPSSTKTP
jgi:protein-disulfide isomerase